MKNSILNGLRWIHRIILVCLNTFISLVRLFLYSKLNTRCPRLYELKDNAFIFGNGPSLKQLLEEELSFFCRQNVIVVNDFFLNHHFTQLKPQVYVIADPGYWETNVANDMLILRQKMCQSMLNDVKWDMLFFVPTSAYRTGYFQKLFQRNSKIFLQPYNANTFKGTKYMRYYFYDKLLAKPFSGNVVGSALFIALQMDISEIYLLGVEHSWTRNLYVDNHNKTCIKTDHFYSNEQEGKEWLKSNAVPYKIHEALFDIANMLSGYAEINEYANHMGVKIYNCTPDSFIDAFTRKNWEKSNK